MKIDIKALSDWLRGQDANAVSARANVSRKTISRLLTSDHQISLRTYMRLMEAKQQKPTRKPAKAAA